MHGDLESSSSPRSEGGRGPWRMWLQGRQGLGRMALTLPTTLPLGLLGGGKRCAEQCIKKINLAAVVAAC